MIERKKILIIEDEKDVAEICAKHLKASGYEVVIAFNGLEGLEILDKMSPDLILLDLGMPQMDGIEFYHRICTDGGYPKYPVLVLTGQMNFEKLFREVSVDGFMTKPFSIDRMLNEVEIIINNQYWRRHIKGSKRVVIVDKDQRNIGKIANAFSNAGYNVDFTDSGIVGIEKIMRNPPELALFNTELSDISVNLVIQRLQRIAKTKSVKFVLYANEGSENLLEAVNYLPKGDFVISHN